MSTGAVTSYAINLDGSLKVISGTVDTHQRETCWIAATDRYAYVTDFASHAITGYRIDMGGSLSLLNQDGVTAGTGEGTYPIDLAVAPDQQFLYVLLPGKSQVGIYRVNDDGSLASLGAVNGDWPIGMQGLAVN
jgi:6-phosphogluconolactonase (cycloisomerase 2 family)